MTSFISGFLKTERFFTALSLYLAILLLSVAAILAMYQVLTRFLLHAPSSWSEIVSIYLVIWSIFLGAAHAFREGMMMSIDIIYRLIPLRSTIILDLFINLCCLFMLGLLVWYGIELTYRVRVQSMAGFNVSMAWAYASLPVGCSFALLAVLGNLVSLHVKQNINTSLIKE